MFTQQNTLQVLIGKDLARTSSVQITDASAASYIADGEIVVLNHLGVPITGAITAATSPRIRLVQRSGATAATAKLKYSDWIYYDKLVAADTSPYVAAQEQIYVVGYDGSTATSAIDVTTDLLDFILSINYTGDHTNWSEQSLVKPYIVPYVSSIKQITVAADLMKQINNDPSAMVSAVALSAATFTASTVATGTATLTNGSKLVTCSGTTPSTDFAVGGYVRIGTTATSTLTLPVYKIESIDETANTITLESPYQGTSGTAATTAFASATAAVAGASNAGLKLTGEALFWQLGEFKYMKNKFKLHYKQGFGTTTLTQTQEAKLGNGVYEQVAELEYFANGNQGALNRHLKPFNGIYSSPDAVSGATYEMLYLSFHNNFSTNAYVAGGQPQPQQLFVAMLVGANQNKEATVGITTAIEEWAVKLATTSTFLSTNITA